MSIEDLSHLLATLGLNAKDVSEVVQLVEEKLSQKKAAKTEPETGVLKKAGSFVEHGVDKKAGVQTLGGASSAESTTRYLLSDEEGYLKKLDILVNSYLLPIRIDGRKLLPKERDPAIIIVKLFSNIEEIFFVHKELLGLLAQSFRSGSILVGKTFCGAIPKMKLYPTYIANFTKAIEFFQDPESLEKNKTLHTWLDRVADSDEQAEGMSLQMLLACPLNRIPQYELLLDQVLKQTPPSHPDYKNLLEAMTLLADLQSDITTALINAERLFPIQAVANRITGYLGPSLESSDRTFLKEGDLQWFVEKDKKERPFHCFLFSDKLVICDAGGGLSSGVLARALMQKGESQSVKFREEIQLQYITVTIPTQPPAGSRFPFEVQTGDAGGHLSYRFSAATDQERKEWIESFGLVFSSLGKTKIFGVDLECISNRDQKEVPAFVFAACSALNQKALDTSGLYRVSGAAKQISLLKDKVDRGALDFDDLDDHVLAGILKLFFRELPKPLLCPDPAKFDRIMAALGSPDSVAQLRSIIQELPTIYFKTAEVLFAHLVKLAERSDKNMMTPSNIAIVFGPNVIRPAYSDNQEQQVQSFGDICLFVEQIILYYHQIFLRSGSTSHSPSPLPSSSSSSASFSHRPSAATAAPPPQLAPRMPGRSNTMTGAPAHTMLPIKRGFSDAPGFSTSERSDPSAPASSAEPLVTVTVTLPSASSTDKPLPPPRLPREHHADEHEDPSPASSGPPPVRGRFQPTPSGPPARGIPSIAIRSRGLIGGRGHPSRGFGTS